MSVVFTVSKTQKVEITHHFKTTSIVQNAPLMHEMEITISSENVRLTVYVATIDVLEAILQNCPRKDFDKLVELARRTATENRE